MNRLKYRINEIKDVQNISGILDENLKIIGRLFQTKIEIASGDINVDDLNEEKLFLLEEFFQVLEKLSLMNVSLTPRDVIYLHSLQSRGELNLAITLYDKAQVIAKNASGKQIIPKTLNQKKYYEFMKSREVVFGIGPAGTGKTYLAVAYATQQLKENAVKKIILTRPAVEAGESLGFLPGDLKEKVDPYLRPLYDCLHEMLGVDVTNGLIEKNLIEIAPLAYMRGRTLDNAAIILDEAQNTTKKQMKMFLTRLGFRSKMIITGDITQTDLPKGEESGLKTVAALLGDIPEIGILYFEKYDVIRNPLVQAILKRLD